MATMRLFIRYVHDDEDRVKELIEVLTLIFEKCQLKPPYFWMELSLVEAAVIVGMALWN